MRIGDVVVRAGGDQQLPRMLSVVCERLAEAMKEKRESALEAAADVGVVRCHVPHLENARTCGRS